MMRSIVFILFYGIGFAVNAQPQLEDLKKELQLSSEIEAVIELPQELKTVMPPADAELGQAEAGLGLAVGTQVSAFTVKTYEGKPITFNELLKQAPLLIVFYRGGWCPYCNFQVREMVQAYPQFKQAGVVPVLISVDEVHGAVLLEKTYNIPFPVLSDPDLIAHKIFQVVLTVDEATVKRYRNEFDIDLEAWSERQHHQIGIPGFFLIDKASIVQWRHVNRDYKVRPSTEQLLTVIQSSLTP
ncbi:MAG: peroxiredoxin-like family protein [Pseudomonadota bacterium]|nr:peroxiredoxin-like family protein [Pseudomonadota bacterium]